MIHWKQIKHRKYAYSSKTLLMNTLNSDNVNPLPSSMYRSYNHIPQSKSMHIMPRGHIETDPSSSRYFATLNLELFIRRLHVWFGFKPSGKVFNWPFRFSKQSGIQSISTWLAQWWNLGSSLIDGDLEKE